MLSSCCMKTTLFNLCLAFLMLLTSCHKEMESVAFENVTESVTLQSVVGDEAFIYLPVWVHGMSPPMQHG